MYDSDFFRDSNCLANPHQRTLELVLTAPARQAACCFSLGPHRSLGSHLARVELQTLYEQLLTRLLDFRLDPAHPPKFHCGPVIGVDTLSLVWDSCMAARRAFAAAGQR